MRRALVLALLLLPAPALAADPPAPVSRPVAQALTTLSGQPVLLPQGPVQVSVSETRLGAGGVLPEHRHAFQRYVYVLEGRIEVANLDTRETRTFKPGDFMVEARDQWHSARVVGGQPVRLLVIDQTPEGRTNMERRAP